MSPKQTEEPHVVDPAHVDSIELPGSVRGSVSSTTGTSTLISIIDISLGVRPIFIDVAPEQSQPTQDDQQIDFHDDHQQRRMKFCWLF